MIIGALIIKELFDYSDNEIVENLMLDLQYALHTTSFEEQPIGTYEYDLWGRPVSVTEATKGIDTNGILTKNPFRYRGYYYDTETGFYYLSSRYYDPEIRRWLSMDSQFDKGAGLIGFNLFVYCANNPVKYFDLTGGFVISTLLVCVAVGAVGGGAVGYVAAPAVVSATGVAGISITSGGISTIAAVGTSFGKLGILVANNSQQIFIWKKRLNMVYKGYLSEALPKLWLKHG